MKKEKRLLTEADKERIKEILKKELSWRDEIIFAYLHGSFTLPAPCGDVDVAIYLDESALSHKHWIYESDLAMSLDRLVGLPVDVLTLNSAPLSLRYHATAGTLLCSKDEKARFDFLERTWREYFDYQPYIKAFYEDLISEPK